MSQKRKPEDDVPPANDSDDESDGSDKDIVDVDFDFYNPEEVDFHALKRLLAQLFSSDAELIALGDLVDIIIEENHVGTTVKVDGQQSDPYAVLSIINLQEQRKNEGVTTLCTYLRNKCPKKDQKTHDAIQAILSLDKPVAWIVSERFINMPVEIMPPMYNLMQQEVKNAIEKKEAYDVEWYMFISKVYKEVASTVDDEERADEDEDASARTAVAPPAKKAKKAKKAAAAAAAAETIYIQPEDEIIASHATYQFDFKFTNSEKEAAADAKRAFSDFGIVPSRKLLLVHKDKFDALVKEIDSTCSNIPAAP
ncbi:p21-C-terminal region-binding protein-domain-containing protein [Gongronella butleri]|nr:p21-C-terminal region-binding protein-domain-containing protein [Gongronella butleri]